MRATLIGAALAALAAAFMAPALAQTDTPARQLFGAQTHPSAGQSAVIGGYAQGCLAGGVQLSADGPGWQAMRPSRNRAWGHPMLLRFIERLSSEALALGWNGILVGDLAQPRGGPMLTGHASHQTGIDVDIWMLPAPGRSLSATEREQLSSVVVVAADGRTLTRAWTPEHHALLRAAASDPDVARIFVNAAIKDRLCRDARSAGEDMSWLRRIRPWRGHDAHFHVRLRCPADSPGCVPQQDPAVGDGCAEVAWWFSEEARSGGGTGGARREKTLADLPAQCAAVLSAAAQ